MSPSSARTSPLILHSLVVFPQVGKLRQQAGNLFERSDSVTCKLDVIEVEHPDGRRVEARLLRDADDALGMFAEPFSSGPVGGRVSGHDCTRFFFFGTQIAHNPQPAHLTCRCVLSIS